jgi:hypothetical protein
VAGEVVREQREKGALGKTLAFTQEVRFVNREESKVIN